MWVPAVDQESYDEAEDGKRDQSVNDRVPCVFLWLTGEPEARVLPRDGRVVVENGNLIRERVAVRLQPNDQVILGLGTNRWSPADDFTESVVDAVEASHPELVQTAKAWRRSLRQLHVTEHRTVIQLRTMLAEVGVMREGQTLEGWLDIQRASPIAPRNIRTELRALWPLIHRYTDHPLEDVVSACSRLRSLRNAAGRCLLQLWKGHTVDIGIDESWLSELVDRLRQEVHVYEVEAVTLGEVPQDMLGWCIPSYCATRFKANPSEELLAPDGQGEDETDIA
jgi:hypothetical protein